MFWLKVFLFLVTTLKAYRVDSTMTDWVNGYDGNMDWWIGNDNMVTGFYSIHDNKKEDRIWKFYYGKTSSSTVYCSILGKRADDYINDWDGPLSFLCPTNQAINAFKSVHDNKREDRRWKIGCCQLYGATLVDVGITNYLNSWDGVLDFTCGDDEVLVGVESVHANYQEDRRWAAQCARLVSSEGITFSSQWSGLQNYWDGALEFDPGWNVVITGLYSEHDNSKEDRRWKFAYGNTYREGKSRYTSGLTCYPQEWSSWMNSWDGVLNFNCPTNHVLNGIRSYHDNKKEDRQWKLKCCQAGGFSVEKLEWTGYLNDWDGVLNYRCPAVDQAIVGLSSYHDNYREDRRWKVICGKLIKHRSI